MEQYSLIQGWSVFRKKFHAMASLKEVSGAPMLIEEYSGGRVPALTCSSVLKLPRMLQCQRSQISEKDTEAPRKKVEIDDIP